MRSGKFETQWYCSTTLPSPDITYIRSREVEIFLPNMRKWCEKPMVHSLQNEAHEDVYTSVDMTLDNMKNNGPFTTERSARKHEKQNMVTRVCWIVLSSHHSGWCRGALVFRICNIHKLSQNICTWLSYRRLWSEWMILKTLKSCKDFFRQYLSDRLYIHLRHDKLWVHLVK